MFNRIATGLLCVTVLTVMGVAQTPPKEKKVKDQQEYDLYKSSTTTTDAAKRLPFLDQWKEKYPESDFKEERLVIYQTTYQALGQTAKAVETAKEILAMDPKEVNALYFLTMYGQIQPATPDSLATGEKAAHSLLGAEKPAGVKDEDWKKIQADMTFKAHKTLSFIAMQKKQPEVAEQELVKCLTDDPNQAQCSYDLGNAILAQKKLERQSEVLYHWARATSLTGPTAIPEPLHKQVDNFFVKSYTSFHGPDEAGLKDLRALALVQPMPPAGFKIKNKNEIEAEKEELAAKADPQAALWKSIKDQLTADAGQQYFDTSVKGAGLPGGANGVKKFKGKLISQKPALNPKELVVGISKPDTPEVTLKLETALRGKAAPGTEIQFEGVPSAFTKDPFMLTFDVDSKDKIEGWPAQAPPAGKKRPTGAKKQQ
jgi:tetratricopeptide (TPR) repeat protein